MKRIAHIAAMAALACSVHVASAEGLSDTAALNVAQLASPVETYEAANGAKSPHSARNTLIELGFGSPDGFPSRGGPIDD